jgi:hypothetical protein
MEPSKRSPNPTRGSGHFAPEIVRADDLEGVMTAFLKDAYTEVLKTLECCPLTSEEEINAVIGHRLQSQIRGFVKQLKPVEAGEILRATLDHFLLRCILAIQQEARCRLAAMAMEKVETTK